MSDYVLTDKEYGLKTRLHMLKKRRRECVSRLHKGKWLNKKQVGRWFSMRKMYFDRRKNKPYRTKQCDKNKRDKIFRKWKKFIPTKILLFLCFLKIWIWLSAWKWWKQKIFRRKVTKFCSRKLRYLFCPIYHMYECKEQFIQAQILNYLPLFPLIPAFYRLHAILVK